jgi:hypothetical protein
MRTTLDIDEDILTIAKETAKARGVSTGKVVSDLARTALKVPDSVEWVDGIPIFPRRPDGKVVTLEMVNALRDEE